MLKKLISLSLLFLIVSCATTPSITTMSYEELEIEGANLSNKLDINIKDKEGYYYGDLKDEIIIQIISFP